MKLSQSTFTSLAAVVGLTFVSSSHAATIYNAATGNTTNFSNNNNGTTAANISVSGTSPDLLFANSGGNFFAGGFASTSDINTLNGAALTAADTVTITIAVDSITHTGTSELRSRGFEFGMSSDTNFSGSGVDSMILSVGGSGNSGTMNMSSGFANFVETPQEPTEASADDGFTVTLTANDAGFTYSFTGLLTGGGDPIADLTGTFAAGEFVSNFGSGHFYASTQKRNAGTSTLDISEGSIDVTTIPEPSAFALLGLGSLGFLIRRRRA